MNRTVIRFSSVFFLSFFFCAFSCQKQLAFQPNTDKNSNNKYILLSIQLLESIKSNESSNELLMHLKRINSDSLAKGLNSDDQKKAFWINIYNAHIQLFLSKNPQQFENRNAFFTKKNIHVSEHSLSFDDIEHGIIRSSRFKLALGLVKNPFASEEEKKFRTKETDGRIHFALNCGAKSCPKIAIYDAEHFNDKIDDVSRSFLKEVCHYDSTEHLTTVTPLFSWFRGDFGGKEGIYKYLYTYGVIPENRRPEIAYSDYDWTLLLGNYYEE